MWEWTRDWIKLRREHSLFEADGWSISITTTMLTRLLGRQSGETVIIAINRSKRKKKITIRRGVGVGGSDGSLILTRSHGQWAENNFYVDNGNVN